MFKMFRNIILIILIFVFALMGCGKSKDEDQSIMNPDEIEDEADSLLSKEEQDSVMNQYYKLLTEKSPVDEIADFIDKNISGLDEENIETMIVSLEDYLSIIDSSMDQDYGLLYQYRDYVSDEMKSYLEIIEREARDIFTDGEKLNIGIDEIMNRAIEAEKHLDHFPKGKIYNKIYDLYGEYIKGALLGAGNPYVFAEDGSTIIKQEYMDEYRAVIEDNKDSKTSQILSQYVELLEKGNGDLNSNEINEFYDKIDILIEDMMLR